MNLIFAHRDVPFYSPSSQEVHSLVVLLHGFGADGHNLLALGQAWAPYLPHTLFLAPHALDPHPSGGGYQWFDLPWAGDFPQESEKNLWAKGVERAGEAMVSFLWEAMRHYNVSQDRIAVVGFSQGAMLALHIGLYRLGLGAVVSYSGLLIPTHRTPQFFPPFLLVHGDHDTVVPVSLFTQTRQALDRAHISYTPLLLKGLNHSISLKAADAGRDFLAQHLKTSEEPLRRRQS